MIATFIKYMEVITPVWSFKTRNSHMKRGKNQQLSITQDNILEVLILG